MERHTNHRRGARDSKSRRDARRDARNRNPMRYKPPVPALPPDYSHIKMQAAAVDPAPNEEDVALEDTFVRRKSYQLEMEEQEEEEKQNPSSIPRARPANFRPQSFAEAAAMNRSFRNQTSSDQLSDLRTSTSQSSLGSFRIALKNNKRKSKKWAPLDLASLDSGTVDSSNASGLDSEAVSETGSERCTSPVTAEEELLLRTTSNSHQASFPPLRKTSLSRSNPPEGSLPSSHIRGKGKDRLIETEDEHSATARTASKKLPVLQFSDTGSSEHTEAPLPSPLHKHKDSKATTDKITNIMSRIDEAFDIEEWDPELPTIAENSSPEILRVKPQPVTYTTVGSLVKSNSAPHFDPPVRIQRDGAGRRPPQTSGGARGIDNYYSSRTTPSHLGYQHTQAYHNSVTTQHNPFLNHQQPSHSPRGFTDNAKETYLMSLGISMSNSLNEDQEASLRSLGVSKPVISQGTTANFIQKSHIHPHSLHVHIGSGPETKGHQETTNPFSQSRNLFTAQQQTISGLDKMQTLQRLAGFSNPMQQHAKDRLSEFAAVRMENRKVASQGSQTTPLVDVIHQGLGAHPEFHDNEPQKGILDYSFRFPATTAADAVQLNPLRSHGDPLQSYDTQSPMAQQFGAAAYMQAPPGYPQPLKAGPPGQRQNAPIYYKPTIVPFQPPHDTKQQNIGSTTLPQTTLQQDPFSQDACEKIPQDHSLHGLLRPVQTVFQTEYKPVSHVHDTITREVAARYYVHGFPDDFTGQYNTLDDVTSNQFHPAPRPVALVNKERYNKHWYAGLSSLQKTAEDHCKTFEVREAQRLHGNYHTPRQVAPVGSERKVVSVEQVKAMSKPEITASLLDNLFGTLMGYADRIPGPDNKSIRSKFVPAPAWTIDETNDGNHSLFGEGWGQPPKRLGRDPSVDLKEVDSVMRVAEPAGPAM